MNVLELFLPIRTFIFDVDGVLTDGNLLLTEEGHLLRSMNIKDAFALQMALRKGYQVWIITGGTSVAIRDKFLGLGIQQVHTSVTDKKDVLLRIAEDTQTLFDQMLFMGDDIPDYSSMKLCGLPCCPSDAAHEIKQIARYISPLSSGKGCVRDVIEKVLKLNGDWEMPS